MHDIHPLIVTSVLFALSLIAAVVLFLWLKNKAIVKLPIGQFGGAVAGFIGVFFVLDRNYQSLAAKPAGPQYKAPAGLESFVSETDGVGFAFPRTLTFDVNKDFNIVGWLKYPDNSNIVVGYSRVTRDPSKSDDQRRKELLENYGPEIQRMRPGLKLEGESEFSIEGVRGKMVEYSTLLEKEELRMAQVVVPNFDKGKCYVFSLTAHAGEYAAYKSKFADFLSTVKFL